MAYIVSETPLAFPSGPDLYKRWAFNTALQPLIDSSVGMVSGVSAYGQYLGHVELPSKVGVIIGRRERCSVVGGEITFYHDFVGDNVLDGIVATYGLDSLNVVTEQGGLVYAPLPALDADSYYLVTGDIKQDVEWTASLFQGTPGISGVYNLYDYAPWWNYYPGPPASLSMTGEQVPSGVWVSCPSYIDVLEEYSILLGAPPDEILQMGGLFTDSSPKEEPFVWSLGNWIGDLPPSPSPDPYTVRSEQTVRNPVFVEMKTGSGPNPPGPPTGQSYGTIGGTKIDNMFRHKPASDSNIG